MEKIFEITLYAMACPLLVPLVIEKQNEEVKDIVVKAKRKAEKEMARLKGE